ncbi:MAG: ABC transporter substrate-binding protein, partial [Anaerolineae bacterium]|nr:ABC transporter substrate-binding protein [Anaerolineae bacterium]
MTRFVKLTALVVLLVVVAVSGCAPAATPAPQPTPTEAAAPPGATPTTEVVATPTPEAPTPKQGGTLVISLGTDVPIFDSLYSSGIPNLGIIQMVSEGLTRIDPLGKDPKVLPVLAESWEQSADGLTWTFKLREGVLFHDGTPFNAEAVRFNIMDRMRNPEAKALAASAFNMIKAVEVVDEYTVNIITEEPFAGLPAQLAYSPMSINSPTQVQKLGNEDYHTAPMGTGPFKFVH